MSKFQTHHNNRATLTVVEPLQQLPSNTIPNQSMTVQEIYSKYASGRPMVGIKNPQYDDNGDGRINLNFDDYMPDLNTLDLADRQELLLSAKAELDAVKKRLNGIANSRKQQSEREKQDLKKRIQQLEEKQNQPPLSQEPE